MEAALCKRRSLRWQGKTCVCIPSSVESPADLGRGFSHVSFLEARVFDFTALELLTSVLSACISKAQN